MYKKQRQTETDYQVNNSYIAEPLELKIQRMINNREPINDTVDLIYTERNDGVLPEYDPRTDRMELAVEVMDKKAKTDLAKRADRHKPKETKVEEPKINPTGAAEDKI